MENNPGHFFVYGSLRSGFKHPAYEYVSRYFSLVGDAQVKGLLYDMGSYPAAISTSQETYIIGELYKLKNAKEFDWAFEQLDDYEGVNPGEGEPALYYRATTLVYINNQTTTAWIYWYAGSIDDQPQITSGDVIEFIQHKSKL